MFSQNALDNAQRLFKALAAREANFDEPIPDDRITDLAAQIGLEGDEFDSALDYAADKGWFEDAEVADSAKHDRHYLFLHSSLLFASRYIALRSTSDVGIDKVVVGEMPSWYGFDTPRLCNTSNKDPRNGTNLRS